MTIKQIIVAFQRNARRQQSKSLLLVQKLQKQQKTSMPKRIMLWVDLINIEAFLLRQLSFVPTFFRKFEVCFPNIATARKNITW